MSHISRRMFLKSGLALGLASPLFSSRILFAADTTLRVFYWGSPERVRRTDRVSELFAKTYPGYAANAEVSSEYWPKLNTMMAGGNMPDIIQLEPNTLADYARRNVLIALDDLVKKTSIQTAEMLEGVLDLARADGKTWGISQAVNSIAMIYDKEAYAKAGIPEPSYGLTWDDYARQCVEIAKASANPRFWGAPYGARMNYVFQVWLTQRDKRLFTEDRKIGFDIEDIREFYDYWEKLRKAGGAAPGDVASKSRLTPDSSEMSTKNCATSLAFSNQLVAFHSILPEAKLGIAPLPVFNTLNSGLFYRPALIWSISRDCKNIEAAAKYINFFVNDMGAGKILGVERGIPANIKIRSVIAPDLDEYAKLSVSFTSAIEKLVRPYPPPAPPGAIETDVGVMRNVGDQLAFGKLSVEEAAKRTIDGFKRAIRQS